VLKTLACGLTALLIAGCASPPPAPPFTPAESARLAALLPADVLLLGEQHDAAEHQQLERQTVEWLAARGQLAALAIEMAEQGRHTTGLLPHASEAEVRAALDWPGNGWPWREYAPMIMAAVRAGVPVLGANLPHALQRQAMTDATLDTRLPPAALQEQAGHIRAGHCDALPESQILPMTRIQIARDRAMAATLASARQPGRVALLVAGNGHVHRALGVPLHLPPEIRARVIMPLAGPDAADETPPTAADLIWPTPPLPPRDYCAGFKPAGRPT
jgi:uncharacterized iron-regulated protein